MKVRVRLFAALRDVMGPDLEIELPLGTTVEELWKRMVADEERLSPFADAVSFAVNHDFVAKDALLNPDDEVAFLPPVSGG